MKSMSPFAGDAADLVRLIGEAADDMEGRAVFTQEIYDNACAYALAMRNGDREGAAKVLELGARIGRAQAGALRGTPRRPMDEVLDEAMRIREPSVADSERHIAAAKGRLD